MIDDMDKPAPELMAMKIRLEDEIEAMGREMGVDPETGGNSG